MRILIYKSLKICYNTSQERRAYGVFASERWDSESQVEQSKQVALSLSKKLSKVK